MTSFLHNVLKVLRGSVIAQVVAALVLPILSRLYSEAAFGAFHAYLSALSILLVMTALRIEVSILTVNEEELADTTMSCFWLSLATGLAVTLAIWGLLGFDLWGERFGALLYILPVVFVLGGWGQSASYVVLRRQDFDRGATSRIVQAAVTSLTAAGMGVLTSTPLGLATGDATGRLAYLVALLRRRGGERFLPDLRFRGPALVRTILRERALVLISLPSALISVAGATLPPFMLLTLFGAAQTGLYSLVERAVGIPTSLIAGAISQVFMSEYSRLIADSPDARRRLFRSIVWKQLQIGIVPAVVLVFVSPVIVPLIFGAKWAPSSAFLQVLTPLFLVSFAYTPVNMLLTIMGRQRLQLFWDVWRLVISLAMWATAWWYSWNMFTAVAVHATLASLNYILYLWICDGQLRSET